MLRRNKTEMEKEVYIWRRKIYFFAKKKVNGEGKGGKYLEKENVFFAGKKNSGKGGSFARGWSMQMIIFKRSVLLDDCLQEASPSCRGLY